MLFEPYEDEISVINHIHKYNTSEYTLIRLTETMIDKNNTDANGLMRDFLKRYSLIDFDSLENGGQKGIRINTTILTDISTVDSSMKFYRAYKRGDPRFSISQIKKLVSKNFFDVGDLLYFTVSKKEKIHNLVLVNVSKTKPNNSVLANIFGSDLIEDSLSRLLPKIKTIAQQGWHPNSKGIGKVANKDAGDTLEHLLGLDTNNLTSADFEGMIELKTKYNLKTLNTLFTLRPGFEGTPVAAYEKNDRSRVSAFARLHGYKSEKKPDMKSLYITIGSEKYPQNRQGFFLSIDDENEIVELRKNNGFGKSTIEAYFPFDKLRNSLYKKHQNTLWVAAQKKTVEDMVFFKYTTAKLTRQPQFTTFLTLIETGDITYDWRGYITPSGKYQGKNHGNAWRITPKNTSKLFGESNNIILIED